MLRHAVSILRSTFADHPLWVLAALTLVLFAARGASLETFLRSIFGRRAATMLAGLSLMWFAGIIVWYVFTDQYSDPIEPSIAAVAWLFQLGKPVYHALNSAELYSHIYGPWAFIFPGWILDVAGPGIAASKAAGAAAALATLAVMYGLLRRVAGTRDVFLLLGALTLLSLAFRNVAFWNRPDPFLVLLSAVAMGAAAARNRWAGAVGVGVCLGVMVNLKVTGAAYALPALGLLLVRAGMGPSLFVVLVAVLSAAVPFVAFSNVSFEHYVFWLALTIDHGLRPELFLQNLEWAVFLLLPLALSIGVRGWTDAERKERKAVLIGLCLGMTVISIAGSTPGASPHHLLPFLPAIFLYIAPCMARFRESSHWVAGVRAFVAAALVMAAIHQSYFVQLTLRTHAMDVVGDIERIQRANPESAVAMAGSDDDEALTFFRPLLVFHSGDYLLDVPAVQEAQLSNLKLPAATFEELKTCRVGIWLVPRGRKPFGSWSAYTVIGNPPVFPEDFREAFLDAYIHTDDSEYFDLWRCR